MVVDEPLCPQPISLELTMLTFSTTTPKMAIKQTLFDKLGVTKLSLRGIKLYSIQGFNSYIKCEHP